MRKLSDLKRVDLVDSDSRIFPGHYAPVMVMENDRRVIKPMRYQRRPAGEPALYDTKYPGTYNARRDNLEGSGSICSACRTASWWSTRSSRT